MKWFNILRDRVRALRQRETVINDIDREMRSHLELQVEANIRAGMSPAEARAEAMRSFGNVNKAVDAAYDVKGGGLLESLTQDIRYGVRMLVKHKGIHRRRSAHTRTRHRRQTLRSSPSSTSYCCGHFPIATLNES
jgi:hypothetical protein